MSTTWGIVATILAPKQKILEFAAYHLEAGAHRLYLFLDDPACDAYDILKKHPKIRVKRCDKSYWRKLNGHRPVKHQLRQCLNATSAYHRKAETDWLIHMDVDEFIVCDQLIADVLGRLPDDIFCARLRPMERLAGQGDAYKAFIPNGPRRHEIVTEIYPEFGKYLKCGFMSHVAGKLFVRTGFEDISLRIHNVFQGEQMNPRQIELQHADLAHCHAQSWEAWRTAFRYRLEKGAYRAGLAAAHHDTCSAHEMLCRLEKQEGEAGLKRFFAEIACNTPALRARLQERGLLRHAPLDLEKKLKHHFPLFS